VTGIEEARSADMWGAGNANSGKKVIVEYTDPNPFKEFHIGHLVPNAIGESISRLIQFSGAEIKRANYQGDVGRHVARAIWGLQKNGDSPDDVKALGKAYATGAAADIDDSPAKEEITAINKKVYDRSDVTINDLYDRGRKTSLDQFEKLYALLGTKFDFYFFESEAAPVGKQIVESHLQDGVFEKSDGAVIYDGEKKGLHKRVFLSSEGLPTYEAKELGLSKMKAEKFPYDVSIIVTGNEINEYFKVLLAAMSDVFPELAAKTKHISHGMMRLSEGKMSSRTGNVITGESLLNELKDVAKVRAQESRADDKERLAQDVAVAAIKYQILKGAASKDIIFDREKALSVEGDSGPYLQYAHARTRAILGKAKEQGVDIAIYRYMEPNTVARIVPRFPEIVARAVDHLEPHILTTYLVELASAFNAWYAQEQILDGTPAAAHKLALVEAVGRTLKNGLWILGIPAPEKM
jgi:arginyl-tRNA synthetase